jgi:serine/threonine protein kinase
MGIVDAVAAIHEVADGDRKTRPIVSINGHFDIKPANLLLGGNGNLLLTDFGSAATGTIGASDYAPPEHDTAKRPAPNKAYDVWSLACLLVQALVFIAAIADGDDHAGASSLATFTSNRAQANRNPDGAFWIRNGQQKMLRKAVVDELDRLQQRRHHQTQIVVDQLRKMFHIDPAERPWVRSCFKRFKSGLGKDVFRIPGEYTIMRLPCKYRQDVIY